MPKTISDAEFKAKKSYVPAKGEQYMSDKQLSFFKDILMEWKKDLLGEAEQTVVHLQDSTRFADLNDQATEEEIRALELRARDRERKLINKINKTISQIDSRDYGFCQECGEEIGFNRLQARPTADLCIECKTIAEMKEKHQAD